MSVIQPTMIFAQLVEYCQHHRHGGASPLYKKSDFAHIFTIVPVVMLVSTEGNARAGCFHIPSFSSTL